MTDKLKNNKFSPAGVYSAMMTPFDKCGEVDFAEVQRIVEFLINKKVNGVFPVSNVGEFLRLDNGQKKGIIKTVCEIGKGKIRITPGITDININSMFAMADYCAECGADAVVVSAPYYYKHTDEYIRTYFNAIADHSALPVCLYNSPSFCNPISTDLLLEICAHPNIVAVKESSGDVKFLTNFMRLIKERDIDIHVLVGWEELTYTGLLLGGSGCVVSSGGIIPEILLELVHSYETGDLSRAFECENSVCKITSAISAYGFPQGYKMAMRSRGFNFEIYQGSAFTEINEKLIAECKAMSELIEGEIRRCALFEKS